MHSNTFSIYSFFISIVYFLLQIFPFVILWQIIFYSPSLISSSLFSWSIRQHLNDPKRLIKAVNPLYIQLAKELFMYGTLVLLILNIFYFIHCFDRWWQLIRVSSSSFGTSGRQNSLNQVVGTSHREWSDLNRFTLLFVFSSILFILCVPISVESSDRYWPKKNAYIEVNPFIFNSIVLC